MTYAEARQLLEELEQLAIGGGWKDERAARDFRAKCGRLAAAAHHSYTHEKIGNAQSWAEILFSARKHARWDSGGRPGHEAVRGFLFNDLERIRMWLSKDPGFTA